MDWVRNHIHCEFVCLAETDSGFHTTSSHPDRKRVRMMIPAPAFSLLNVALDKRCSSELAAPDD